MNEIDKDELNRALRIMGLVICRSHIASKYYTVMTLNKPHRKVLLHYETMNEAHEEHIYALSFDEIWHSVFGKNAANSFIYIVRNTILRHKTEKRIVIPNFMHGCYSVEEGFIQRDLQQK